MAQHHHGLRVRVAVDFFEAAPEGGPYPEYVEQSPGHERRWLAPHLRSIVERHHPRVGEAYRRKGLVAIPEMYVRRGRLTDAVEAARKVG